MQIAQDLLVKLQTLRDARKIIPVLPGLIDTAAFDAARKAVWTEVRARHNLPKDLKFKVELDGPLAGELRRKADGQPYDAPTAVPDTSFAEGVVGALIGAFSLGQPQTYVVVPTDDDEALQKFDNLDAMFAYIKDETGLRCVAIP